MASESKDDEELREKLETAKRLLKKANRKDLYALLNVTSDASEAEIKKGYKKAGMFICICMFLCKNYIITCIYL